MRYLDGREGPVSSNSPDSITAEQAVRRGQLIVNGPVVLLLIGPLLAAVKWSSVWNWGIVPAGFVAAWLWWSFSVPRWRNWALDRGADPDELQSRGERAGIVWPVGSFFEKTEFRRKRE
jgi:hypothetical protein